MPYTCIKFSPRYGQQIRCKAKHFVQIVIASVLQSCELSKASDVTIYCNGIHADQTSHIVYGFWADSSNAPDALPKAIIQKSFTQFTRSLNFRLSHKRDQAIKAGDFFAMFPLQELWASLGIDNVNQDVNRRSMRERIKNKCDAGPHDFSIA